MFSSQSAHMEKLYEYDLQNRRIWRQGRGYHHPEFKPQGSNNGHEVVLGHKNGLFKPKSLRQLDAAAFKEYKMRNHPVGACQIIITIDKTNNRTQECKRLRPLFSCLRDN